MVSMDSQPRLGSKAGPGRAELLIVCPRRGFGNSLRVMVSALHTARENGLALAHLWRTDSPIGFTDSFEDELAGARACNFESFFRPIPECPPFVNRGQRIRLFCEAGNEASYEGLNIVEVVAHPCVKFQHHGPFQENDFANVDAVLLLTSLNVPITPRAKIELYQRYFKPVDVSMDALRPYDGLLSGNWLAVHLRTSVRTAFAIPEWSLEELVEKARDIIDAIGIERIIVFSDSAEARGRFVEQSFNGLPVSFLDWKEESYPTQMFLDFLAISKASFILSSGVSSFSYEASLYGGGVPIYDMCQGLLLPAGTETPAS